MNLVNQYLLRRQTLLALHPLAAFRSPLKMVVLVKDAERGPARFVDMDFKLRSSLARTTSIRGTVAENWAREQKRSIKVRYRRIVQADENSKKEIQKQDVLLLRKDALNAGTTRAHEGFPARPNSPACKVGFGSMRGQLGLGLKWWLDLEGHASWNGVPC